MRRSIVICTLVFSGSFLALAACGSSENDGGSNATSSGATSSSGDPAGERPTADDFDRSCAVDDDCIVVSLWRADRRCCYSNCTAHDAINRSAKDAHTAKFDSKTCFDNLCTPPQCNLDPSAYCKDQRCVPCLVGSSIKPCKGASDAGSDAPSTD